MSISYGPEQVIAWDESHFLITGATSHKVIKDVDGLGWCDDRTWEMAMLDGPIADLRRFNDQQSEHAFYTPVNPYDAIVNMLATSRGIFLRPLIQLEDYARHYNTSPQDAALLYLRP